MKPLSTTSVQPPPTPTKPEHLSTVTTQSSFSDAAVLDPTIEDELSYYSKSTLGRSNSTIAPNSIKRGKEKNISDASIPFATIGDTRDSSNHSGWIRENGSWVKTVSTPASNRSSLSQQQHAQEQQNQHHQKHELQNITTDKDKDGYISSTTSSTIRRSMDIAPMPSYVSDLGRRLSFDRRSVRSAEFRRDGRRLSRESAHSLHIMTGPGIINLRPVSTSFSFRYC